jgi:hydrogenase expression/formation protein HypD
MRQPNINVHQSLHRFHKAAREIDHHVKFMEVCGTHTMSAFRCGLHSLMPENVTLLSGPGCPVCVTSQSDIDLFINTALEDNVILCTYGDMLRVPGRQGSLERIRSQGRDIRVVYSALDSLKIAHQYPEKEIVFAAVGFETTTPPTAVAILEAEKQEIPNFSVLVSHKRIIPAMKALLESGDVHVDGFLCPGHVSVIIGSDAYRPIVEDYQRRCVISGFEDMLMVDSLTLLVEQVRDGVIALENLYPQAVSRQGNLTAQGVIDQVFEPAENTWRGVGTLPESGLALKASYRRFDARWKLGLATPDSKEHPGCRCGDVITARCEPPDCKLFGRVCTPVNPLGPCMVSSEGTCQAWFKYNRGEHKKPLGQEVHA